MFSKGKENNRSSRIFTDSQNDLSWLEETFKITHFQPWHWWQGCHSLDQAVYPIWPGLNDLQGWGIQATCPSASTAFYRIRQNNEAKGPTQHPFLKGIKGKSICHHSEDSTAIMPCSPCSAYLCQTTWIRILGPVCGCEDINRPNQSNYRLCAIKLPFCSITSDTEFCYTNLLHYAQS